MNTAELVVVRCFANAVHAAVAASALEAAGIEVLTRRDDCGGMRPQLWLSGVEVVVRSDDAPRALEILQDVPSPYLGDSTEA
jgi:predicted Fe-Mo cluster-binding NifX family protein